MSPHSSSGKPVAQWDAVYGSREAEIIQLPARRSPVTVVLGIDPGPSTGICLLLRPGSARAFQCDAASAPWLLDAIIRRELERGDDVRVRGGIEGFAPGNGPGARMSAGAVTRALIEELAAVCAAHGVPLTARYASAVKTWAADARLRKAGLYELTAGGTHSRDAARHALMEAVQNCGWPDPLSRKTDRDPG